MQFVLVVDGCVCVWCNTRDGGSCLRNVEVGRFLVGWSPASSPKWVVASVVGSRGAMAGWDALFCGAKTEVCLVSSMWVVAWREGMVGGAMWVCGSGFHGRFTACSGYFFRCFP